MQFRIKGSRVQCIRSKYCPTRKRSFGKVIASQASYLKSISEEIGDCLANNERDEFQSWLDSRNEEKDRQSAIDRVEFGKHSIEAIAVALEMDAAIAVLDQSKASAFYNTIDRLTQKLRKAGYTRKKCNIAEPKTAPCDQQISLPM
ncbi:MAG: hypothetical protein ACSHXZ_14985 [Gammaproteobacteria bacterium]